MDPESNWKGKAMLIGGIVGALTGVGAAYLLARRAERQGGRLRLSAGQGMRLGVLVLGLLRQVAALGEGED